MLNRMPDFHTKPKLSFVENIALCFRVQCFLSLLLASSIDVVLNHHLFFPTASGLHSEGLLNASSVVCLLHMPRSFSPPFSSSQRAFPFVDARPFSPD